jgi:hypothetical protein
MSMEKGAAIVAKRTVACCGRALTRTAATDSMQNVNYTKVTPLPRPVPLRPVAVLHWKEVSCNHDGLMRMESDYSACRSTRKWLTLRLRHLPSAALRLCVFVEAIGSWVSGVEASRTVIRDLPDIALEISPVLASRNVELEKQRGTSRSDRPAKEKHAEILERIRNFFDLNEG